MATRDQIAANVLANLESSGLDFYTADDTTDAIQDGYDDVAVVTGCIQKTATVSFESNLSYYDFSTLIADYYSVVAIYNNVTKRWMIPDQKLSMASLRRDWELIKGNSMFFFPIDCKRVFLSPRLENADGDMTVFYRAQAPTLSGSDVPLIHVDEHELLEWYATGDLFDQAEEYTKAEAWWSKYFDGLMAYKSRVQKLAMSDYLPVLQPVA